MTVIQFSQLNQYQPVYGVLVRYSPLLNAKDIEEKLKEDSSIIKIRGKAKSDKRGFSITKNFAWIAFDHTPKKDTVEQIANKVLNFIEVLSQYARPLPVDICEGDTCKYRLGGKTKLTFINNYPQFLCDSCIAQTSKYGEKAKEEYKNAPAKLFRGILAGTVGAFLGGIVWALVAAFFDTIAAVLAIGIHISIIRLMDKAGTKRTVWSILIATFLSFVGVVFGTYLSIIFYSLKEELAIFSITLLVEAWEILWEKPELLKQSLFFAVLGMLYSLWVVWSNTKEGLSREFKPDVEIVETDFC